MKKTRHLLLFESRSQPLLARSAFAKRLALVFILTLLLIALSLFAGMLGYHFLESMPWIDAFTSAAMILSGMGPLEPLHTSAGKIFAGLYALYSGLALLVAAGILLAPIFHRFLHYFHLESKDQK